MPICEYECSRGHTFEEFRYIQEGHREVCAFEGCKAKVKPLVPSSVTFKFARGQAPKDHEDNARVKEHNATPEFKKKRDSGEIVHESEIGVSRDPDTIDGGPTTLSIRNDSDLEKGA